MVQPLPLFVDLDAQPCLVVGGGEVAAAKLRALIAAGARCHVVALALGPAMTELVTAGNVRVSMRGFEAADVTDNLLVIAATDDAELNGQVYRACQAQRVLCNAVDDRDHCSAIFPSVVRRDEVQVAVSTGGQSPTLARRLRAQLETVLPRSLGRLATFVGLRRAQVKGALPDVAARREFWDAVFEGSIPALIEADRGVAAAEQFDAMLAAPAAFTGVGLVSLVGAGPGDPGLLTIKALGVLQRADVVLYDNLVSDAVLELCRRDARRVYVGKKRAFASVRQSAISEMLADEAARGQRVVRLKGGDPFIFGRGGEEIEALARRGVAFEIVPGITAALGCAAYAHIPLTHRDVAQSVRFVTGHRRGDEANLDWPELAKANQTLVVYMGLQGLARLCAELVAHGLPGTTPAALISRGTLPDQEVHVTDVASMPDLVVTAAPKSPTTLIVGGVVALRERLNAEG